MVTNLQDHLMNLTGYHHHHWDDLILGELLLVLASINTTSVDTILGVETPAKKGTKMITLLMGLGQLIDQAVFPRAPVIELWSRVSTKHQVCYHDLLF
jgi:hypothetical protein